MLTPGSLLSYNNIANLIIDEIEVGPIPSPLDR